MRPLRWAWLLASCISLGVGAQNQGPSLFAIHCSTCHQADGSGTVGLAPALKGDHWEKLGKDRSYLLNVITKGLSGRIEVHGQTFMGHMPSFASQLDDASLAAIATHVLELQHPASLAVPYSVEDVAAVRKDSGNPTQTRQLRQSLLSAN
jgi:mono/diheme cytochrome c family protein